MERKLNIGMERSFWSYATKAALVELQPFCPILENMQQQVLLRT
jgi:hypothetical protein